MITIVIADDEKLIRAGIAKILKDNIDIPLEILEAKNGKEALDLCVNEQPTVLITDIRMPIMDGVELMKNVSKLETKPVIIVSSGFDDFEYAKAAIQNGAMQYILKPIDKKELVETVEKAIQSYRVQEQKRNETILKAIIDEGRVDNASEINTSNLKNGGFCVAVAGARCKSVLNQVLQSVSYNPLESKKEFECVVIPREALYLIETDLSLNQYVVGISNCFESVTALRSYKKQAFEALLQSFFANGNDLTQTRKNGLYYYSKIATEPNFSKIDACYEKLVSKINISQVEDIQNGLTELLTFDNDKNEYFASELDYIYNKLKNNLFTRFPGFTDNDVYLHLKAIMIENLWQLKSLQEWKVCISDYLIYLSALLKKDNSEYPYIDEAIAYIKSNFKKNINMAMVANYVSVNYTWFSEKFKEHTGMLFNDYLRKLRIEEACNLLKKDCFKVYEVAQKSGFGDVKYFMKTFKEETGLSPTEWKKVNVPKS